MDVTLTDREPAFVAYLRHTGPYGETLSRFWQQVVYPWMRENSLLGHARYGISHDDPGITDAARCRYDACVEVDRTSTLVKSALTSTIPGGRYAVLDFKGTSEEIGGAWNELLRDWLPSSGYQLDSRPCFEYYPEDATHDPLTGVFGCKICIPVSLL